jgi:CBS domain-containing protein
MKVSMIIETKIARVKSVMQDTAEKSSVSVSSSIRDALSLIATRHNSAMIVLDSKNLMVGIVTEKDIIVALEKHGVDVLDKEVASIMSPDPLTTNLDAPCKDVLITMINGKFRNMPVYDGETFHGIVQTLEVAEGKLSEVLDENRKLRDLIGRLVPRAFYCVSSDNVEDVHQKILENNLPCVPVIDSNRVVSVIADYEFLTLIGKEDISKARLLEGSQD